ncbi:MAG: hypothetical protein KDA53_15870 [Hyphomonas sp.]|nr:hypothetical protein [Hyphomonas sp.]
MFIQGALRSISAALLACLTPCFAHALGLNLQPATVEIELQTGSEATRLVTITNTGRKDSLSLTLGVADWSLDETGSPVLAARDAASPTDGWVSFSPRSLTLKPGESRQVKVSVDTPADLATSGDLHIALRASTVLPDPANGAGAWKRHEAVSWFYLTSGDAESLPVIEGSRLTLMDDGTPAIGLDISNVGNAHARLQGTVEITGAGSRPFSLPVSGLIVPRESRTTCLIPLTQPLPADPDIEVRLSNVFAPQETNETAPLAPYRVNTGTGRAALP